MLTREPHRAAPQVREVLLMCVLARSAERAQGSLTVQLPWMSPPAQQVRGGAANKGRQAYLN